MKKSFTLLLLSFSLSTLSFAQFNYGVKIGITQSKTEESIESNYQDMKFKTGLQLGAFADYKLFKNLSVRPALQLTQKGYKAIEGKEAGPIYRYRNWSLSYLEIPVDFVYRIPVTKATNFYFGAGPVLSFGLFGHGKWVYNTMDILGEMYLSNGTEYKPFSKNNLKHIDLGADFVAGFQYKKFAFAASYNHGLLNILRFDQGIQSTRNRSFAFSIGYMLKNPGL